MSIRLLIVDDEASVLEVLTSMLEPLGNKVVAEADGQKAVDYLDTQKFDGIIVDAHMPPPNGFELIRHARASSLNSKAPILLLTAFDDADTMREGFKAGATYFLGKPLPPEQLHRLVNTLRAASLMERRRSARLPLQTKVECVWGNQVIQKRLVAESLNISERGMLLAPSGGLEVGQELTLEFRLSSADVPLRMRAKVIRLDSPDRVAVKFVGSTGRDQETIQNYINARLQDRPNQ